MRRQLLHRNLQRIRFSVQGHQNRRVHTATRRNETNQLSSLSLSPSLEKKRTFSTHLICKARVPKILAFSYFVMYGVVTLILFACAGTTSWGAPISTIPFTPCASPISASKSISGPASSSSCRRKREVGRVSEAGLGGRGAGLVDGVGPRSSYSLGIETLLQPVV